MSFVFPSWSTAFSESFINDAKGMLETALNKGNKPPVIQGRIEVVDLNMGEQIGDLSLDRFRGILRLGYQGDAWIEIRCRVQANPLSHNPNLLPSSTLPIATPLLASQPLLVPMTLRLSKLHLRAILILVVSASKGITLVFKNDPLQNVDVSSTFDSVEVIRGYLQQEIEGQLREMFREDLPGIIHRLSQRWFSKSGTGGHVETPYRDAPTTAEPQPYDVEDEYDPHNGDGSMLPGMHAAPRRRALHRASTAPHSPLPQRSRQPSIALSESPTSYTVFPDIENYDPTYGLRPEGLPTHSGYEAFGRLWEKARGGGGRGLGSLMDSGSPEMQGAESDSDAVEDGYETGEDTGEDDGFGGLDDIDDVFDTSIEHQESVRSLDGMRRRQPRGHEYHAHHTPPRSGTDSSPFEWETYPAVGGGVVTRPRVFHSQSQIRAPSEAGGAMPSPAGTAGTANTATGGSVTARASSIGGTSTVGSLYGAGLRAYGSPGPSRASSTLRRSVASHSDLPQSQSRHSDAVLQRGTPHPHPRSRPHSPLPGSPLRGRSQSGPGRSRTASPVVARTVSHTPAKREGWDTSPPKQGQGPQQPHPARAQTARHRASTEPPQPQHMRRERTTSFGTSASILPRHALGGGITLPLNNSVSQLATLSLSANTLSPYARSHEHIAVRSFPHLGRTASAASTGPSAAAVAAAAAAGAEGGGVKARRKRIFRIGSSGPSLPAAATTPPSPEGETPGLEWDDETTAGGTRLAPSSSSGRAPGGGSIGGSATSGVKGRLAHVSSRSSYGFPRIDE